MNIIKYITLIITFSCFAVLSIQAQEVKVYKDFDQFEQEILKPKEGKKLVVNFWATWCKPCVKEMPYFLAAAKLFENQEDIEFVWVSLDFSTKKLQAYANEHNITDRTVMLAARKQNEWIAKVHKDWNGAIPITLFITKDNKTLSSDVYHSENELIKDIKKYLK